MKTIPVWNEVLLSQTCLLRLWWQLPEKMQYSSSLCSEVVALCVGREESVFSGRTLYPSADAFSSQKFCFWDEGHQEKRRWGSVPQENMGKSNWDKWCEHVAFLGRVCCHSALVKANVLFWWSRGPPRGAALPALLTYTTAHQGLNPILSQSLRQLWRWRRVWMRRRLSEQLSKLHLERKTRNTGRTEGRGRQADWKGEPRGRQGRGEW